MEKKEQHRLKLIEYLGNPENEFLTRTSMAEKVLKISISTFYHHFRPSELDEIETQGLAIRRLKYSPELAKIDKALIDRAIDGDSKAIKLAYQKFENWMEGKKIEIDGDLKTPGLSAEIMEMFNKVYKPNE